MSLTPRLIALQGLGDTPLLIAVQGLLGVEVTPGVIDYGGVVKETVWDSAKPLKQLLREKRLRKDDDEAIDFIISLITSEFLNG